MVVLVVVLAVFVLALLVSGEVCVLVLIVGAWSLFLRLLTMRLLPSPLMQSLFHSQPKLSMLSFLIVCIHAIKFFCVHAC